MTCNKNPSYPRLDGLRQLGNSHYVFKKAQHRRSDHSIGVMFLAGKVCFLHILNIEYPTLYVIVYGPSDEKASWVRIRDR